MSISNTQLKRQLKRLEQDTLRMGALVEQSFRLSNQALFQKDLAAVQAIPDLDKQIDQFYRQIESDCVLLITLQAPASQDSRLIGAFMQLIRDLERIGDYAKDIAEIASQLFPYQTYEILIQNLPQIELMFNHAQAMLATSLTALSELDAEVGKRVKELDSTVDDLYDQIYQNLAGHRDIKGSIEPFLLIVLAIRHLERMADHATNIGQRVAYIVIGHRP
jgi:phosphate transport system protein